MELRNAETEIDEIAALYISLRHGDNNSDWQQELAPLSDLFPIDNPKGKVESATAALKTLESVKERLEKVQTLMEKFDKRLKEKDPVTEKPRYGTKTATRVQDLLKRNKELVFVILHRTFGGDEEWAAESSSSNNNKNALSTIRQLANQEETEKQRKEQEELERQQREEAERLAAEQRVIEEQRRQEEAERQQIEDERQELARQARMAREAQLQAQRAAAAADREWLASIPNKNTVEGVKEQLKILIESTSRAEPDAQMTAVKALHTIFSQIVSHPEEPNFRRIRRDHPKFLEDIGRHEGGKEFLIAAGFTLGFVDEVPSFVSKEPNLEVDMDGWSAWFDLNKATLKILEQQILK